MQNHFHLLSGAEACIGTHTVNSIAEQLGVAPCTVSSVLNGQAERRRIRVDTARRIQAEAKRLHYVPNSLARGLRNRRSNAIGLLFSDFTNNWVDHVMNAMDPVFEQRKYLPFIMTHRGDPECERRSLNALVERCVDGIIAVPMAQRSGVKR